MGQFCVRHQYYGGDIPHLFCESAGVDNVQVWGYGTSAATLVVAVMGPVLGAVGDHKGMKKKLFTGFLAAGILFTLMMAVFDQWQLLLAGYVISYIGFAGSCLFYDSFLTDVTTEERMDRISSCCLAEYW